MRQRVSAICLLLIASAMWLAGPAEAGEGHLIRQAEGPGFVFEANDAPIAAALDELEAAHGITIGGREHVRQRRISGRFEGTMPEVIERIFREESFALFFREQASAAGTRISRLVFTGRVDGAPAAVPPETPRLNPAERRRLYYEGLPPPPIPDVVAHAIAPPPPHTPEREAFDNEIHRISTELEEALRPLRALSE